MPRHHRLLSILALSIILTSSVNGARHGKGYGWCAKSPRAYTRAYPAQFIDIPIDHFHNESRYEPHLNGTYPNRYWFDATYYKPGGPVIVEQKGEDPYVELTDLRVGMLHSLARATNGIAVIFEHRYYGSDPVKPVDHLKDFRFLSVDQAMADQAYFAQNVVFSGLEQYDLTAPNTPWFAIGASYPGAFTAWIRIRYPNLFFGAIASSAVTALIENYWQYYDVVSKYSPSDCVEVFGKMIDMADDVLLGGNETAIKEFKDLWPKRDDFATNSSVGDFAYWHLEFPYILQGKSWIPCLEAGSLKGCNELTWPTILYPKVEKLRPAVKSFVDQSKWANESNTLTTAWLNYLGLSIYYHEVNSTTTNTTASSESLSASEYPGMKFKFSEGYLAWQYQQCTEIGLFITGENPTPNILPVISRTQSLHFIKNMECRNQLYIDLKDISVPSQKLLDYGNFNISYNRLMFTGGEVDPWRPATQLATLGKMPDRLNYSSTLDQPWFLIPNASHAWDYFGVFPNQPTPGVPPEGIKRVHLLEKEAILRWLGEWREMHPDRGVRAR